VAPGLGFASFPTADRTLRGYKAMNMIKKGQIKGVEKEDITGQVKIHRKPVWHRCVKICAQRLIFAHRQFFATKPF
jgi:hypothetical protein